MTRVKRGTTSNKKRKSILKMVKGAKFKISTKERKANETIRKGGKRAFHDRRKKKGVMRGLSIIKINALSREMGLPYNQLIKNLSNKKCGVNRKMLGELAEDHPDVFKKIVEYSKK